MTEPAIPVVSVRGEARVQVPPDSASLDCVIAATRPAIAAALDAAAAAQARLTDDLRAMGGVLRDPGSERRALTWSAYSAGTHAEGDKSAGEYRLTGNVTATVAIEITIRAFGQLTELSAMLARHHLLAVHQVSWQADWDNPAWPQVREAAIHAALGKARDYAAALGGSLRDVVHIADAGLLGNEGSRWLATSAASGGRLRHHGDPDVPALSPVPQELTAVIEAQFSMSGVSVTSSPD